MKWNRRIAISALTVTALILAPAALQGRTPRDSGTALSKDEAKAIVTHAQQAAAQTASAEGLRSNTDATRGPVVQRATRMHVAVVSRDGKILSYDGASDAWVGSEDIAIAKARTAAFFSSDENALTSRIVGELSQASNEAGKPAGPLWGIGTSNQPGATGDKERRNGLITFPGGVPLYKDGKLVGGIGVSGDAVDQDEAVAFAGAVGFEPGPNTVKLGLKIPAVPALDTAVPRAASPAGATTETTTVPE